MKNSRFCGSNSETQISSFAKVVCLGYYDGPTMGLALSTKPETAYRFEIAAWDSHCENRVYALAETHLSTFDSLVQILEQIEPPRWPVWVPRWQFDSAEQENQVSKQVDKVLAEIPPSDCVIATDELDKRILACRELGVDAIRHLPKSGALPNAGEWSFWQEYLGLGKG